MAHETDISWQIFRQVVRDWAGTAAELVEVKPLVGGVINTTLALRTADGQRAVLKVSPHRVDLRYQEEAHQLGLLRDAGLPVPGVYDCRLASLDRPHSYLLMQFMDGVDMHAARRTCTPEQLDQVQGDLAELVVRMHEHTAERYHRCLPADAEQFDGWAAFFRHVYDPIWREVEKSELLPVKTRKLIGRIHGRLDHLLGHGDRPRLTHGDLWATNLLCGPGPDGCWRITAILDPNCKYAHAELEIAYLELFQTITPAFTRIYQQARRPSGDYVRLHRPIYQLYSLINHLRLFGNEYLKPLLGAVERAGALV